MKPGEAFDPVEARAQRIYPVDWVDALPGMSDGPKRLFSKLFQVAVTADRRRHPWLGYVYVSEKSLAQMLGKSTSGIRRDSSTLRAIGLIRTDRPKNAGNNRYFFLWKAEYHRSDVSGAQLESEDDHSADVSGGHSADVSCAFPDHSSDGSGDHSADVSGVYKEEPIEEPIEEGTGSPSKEAFSENPSGAVFGKKQTPPPGYAFDEHYEQFRAAWRKWGANVVDPEDYHDAWWAWLPLDFQQRTDVITAITARITAGVDPLGWKAKNFIRKGEYKRPIAKPAAAQFGPAMTYTSSSDYERKLRAE